MKRRVEVREVEREVVEVPGSFAGTRVIQGEEKGSRKLVKQMLYAVPGGEEEPAAPPFDVTPLLGPGGCRSLSLASPWPPPTTQS